MTALSAPAENARSAADFIWNDTDDLVVYTDPWSNLVIRERAQEGDAHDALIFVPRNQIPAVANALLREEKRGICR